MGRQRSDGTAKLTRRESEVLALLRVGLTNAEIAERLGISFETAKHHVAQILAKLQVATREQAAVWEPEARESLWFPMIARWLLVGGAATALAGLAVLGFLVARTSSADPDRSSYAGILTGEVLYMPPPGVETIWIASPDALDEAGIHVVSGPGKMWVGGGLPEAIIIDQHWWAVINQDRPWPWFNEYKRQGVVVVGARVSMDELLSGLDAGRWLGRVSSASQLLLNVFGVSTEFGEPLGRRPRFSRPKRRNAVSAHAEAHRNSHSGQQGL